MKKIEKIDKKILSFPKPKEPAAKPIVCQIGRQRFAIHWWSEDLPPVPPPPLQLKPPPRKKGSLSGNAADRSRNDLLVRPKRGITVVNAATAAPGDPQMTTSVPEKQTHHAPVTATVKGAIPARKARVAKRRAQVAPSQPKPSQRATRAKNAATARHGSKTAKILELLRRSGGASLKELTKATGWQPHSIRGFLSGTLGKKMEIPVESFKSSDGQHSYRISSK